jgi:hypothetical protein
MKKKPAAKKPAKTWRRYGTKTRKVAPKMAKFIKHESEKVVAKSIEPAVKTAVPAAEPIEEGCQTPVGNGVCGKPLAPGQSSVCADHIRRG